MSTENALNSNNSKNLYIDTDSTDGDYRQVKINLKNWVMKKQNNEKTEFINKLKNGRVYANKNDDNIIEIQDDVYQLFIFENKIYTTNYEIQTKSEPILLLPLHNHDDVQKLINAKKKYFPPYFKNFFEKTTRQKLIKIFLNHVATLRETNYYIFINQIENGQVVIKLNNNKINNNNNNDDENYGTIIIYDFHIFVDNNNLIIANAEYNNNYGVKYEDWYSTLENNNDKSTGGNRHKTNYIPKTKSDDKIKLLQTKSIYKKSKKGIPKNIKVKRRTAKNNKTKKSRKGKSKSTK